PRAWCTAVLRLWREHFGLEYRFNERVFRQVFVIQSYDGFGFSQRREPPLNLEIFISRNAFDNSMFFYDQLQFARFVLFITAAKVSAEIDAPSRDPIPLYDTLIRCRFPVYPAFQNLKICHANSLTFLHQGGTVPVPANSAAAYRL